MKKLALIGTLILFSCNSKSIEQRKAEVLVKKYLDSMNNNKNYEITKFNEFHPIYDSFADDSSYEKLKNNPLKLDSLKKAFKPTITSWGIFVTFKGTQHDNEGTHTYQCLINKNLTKCIVCLDVGDFK
ncbi:MAG: hypothetical protein ACTHJ8_04825 [Mucilaginibacter sp.]